MNVTTIEYSRRPAKDKIDRTFYIAIFIVLATTFSIGIERILETKETTVFEKNTISTYKTGYSLSYRPRGILKRNILGIKVRSINIAGRRTGSSFFSTKAILLLRIIIIRKYSTLLTYQGNINFAFGYYNFLFIHTFTHQYRSTDILAEIGNSINGFLYSEKVSATILCYYEIIMTYILSQFRYFLSNGIHSQTGYNATTVYIQVGIIFTSFRYSGNLIGRYPHEQLFRVYRSHAFYQVVRNLIHIHKCNTQFFRYISRRVQIGSVRINQLVTFSNSRLFRSFPLCIRIHTLLYIILTNSLSNCIPIRCAEVSAHNGVKQNRDTSLSTCFVYKTFQVFIKSTSRSCIPLWVGLLIIVTELDKYIITFLHL